MVIRAENLNADASEESWELRDDFEASGPEDRVAVLEPTQGEVGDGVHRRIPPLGGNDIYVLGGDRQVDRIDQTLREVTPIVLPEWTALPRWRWMQGGICMSQTLRRIRRGVSFHRLWDTQRRHLLLEANSNGHVYR